MPDGSLTVASLFVGAALSVAIVLVAFLAALLIAQRRRIAQERAHARRVLAAQEDERARVARELHDDALQRIAVIRHEVDEAASRGGPDVAHRLGGVSGDLQDLSVVLRSAAHQLHPSVVEKAGLSRALTALGEEFGRTSGLNVRVGVPLVEPRLASGVGVAAYRIAQEALRNVVKHAGVSAAEVTLRETDGAVSLRIADAGGGIAGGAPRPEDGLGLIAMRQRAEGAGGRLTVAPPADGTRGTVVTVVFPAPS